jgi:hypothetical protein
MKESSELKIKNTIKKSIKGYALRISGNYMVEEYAEQYADDLTEEIWNNLETVLKSLKVS